MHNLLGSMLMLVLAGSMSAMAQTNSTRRFLDEEEGHDGRKDVYHRMRL